MLTFLFLPVNSYFVGVYPYKFVPCSSFVPRLKLDLEQVFALWIIDLRDLFQCSKVFEVMSKDFAILQIKKTIQPSPNKIETDAIQQNPKNRT
jgi:hypothetical protein